MIKMIKHEKCNFIINICFITLAKLWTSLKIVFKADYDLKELELKELNK